MSDALATITMPYSQAIKGSQATLPFASKDDMTPIIMSVRIDRTHFLSTDRYAVGKYEHTTAEEWLTRPTDENGNRAEDDGAFLLVPRDVLEWLVKQTLKSLGNPYPHAEPTVEFSASSVVIRLGSDVLAQRAFIPTMGNFPPVERLIPSLDDENAFAEAAPTIALKPEFIIKFAQAAQKVSAKESAMRFRFTKTSNPSRPGPVVITFENSRFVGLLQPNLLLR